VAELAKGDADESWTASRPSWCSWPTPIAQARNILTFWTMGVNQHQRGTWVNTQLYALHLLLGKYGNRATARFR
jgi:nitrate reductase NapA